MKAWGDMIDTKSSLTTASLATERRRWLLLDCNATTIYDDTDAKLEVAMSRMILLRTAKSRTKECCGLCDIRRILSLESSRWRAIRRVVLDVGKFGVAILGLV